MNCPTCSVDLLITERQGIEIDYCPKCRGIWLDRGELDKIIERSTSPAIGPTIPAEFPGYPSESEHYRDRDRDRNREDDRGKKKRKSSFLGDLFDF